MGGRPSRSSSVPAARSTTSVTGDPPRDVGGRLRRRCTVARRSATRSANRAETWSVRCRPCSRARSSSASTSGPALRLEPRGQAGDEQRRRDAVLVAHVRRVDAVAERLLVPEHQAVDARDPLEAGERRAVPVARARRRSGRAGATRRSSWRAASRRGAPVRRRRSRRAEQRPGLVAVQHPPALGLGRVGSAVRPVAQVLDRDGAPVGVGVERDHEVGALVAAPGASARSIAPGSSGLGNATVGKSRVRLGLLGTTCTSVNPASREHALRRPRRRRRAAG